MKLGRCDPNNHHRMTVDQHLLPNYVGAAVLLAPECVPKHDYIIAAPHCIVLRSQQPACKRTHAEYRKEVAGDDLCLCAIRVAVAQDIRRTTHPRNQALHNRTRPVPNVQVHRIRENRFKIIAIRMAGKPSGLMQHHELPRISHRKIAQQHLIKERENSRSRADSQSESRHRHAQENRAAAQGPPGVSEVTEHELPSWEL